MVKKNDGNIQKTLLAALPFRITCNLIFESAEFGGGGLLQVAKTKLKLNFQPPK